MGSNYEIPPSGKLSINSLQLLNNDEKYVQHLLELSNISPKALQDDMKHVEEWCEKQPHLPDDPSRKRRTFQMLIMTGASVEKTKVKLDNYYSLKNKFPELFLNRDPSAPEIDRELRYGYFIILPKTTSEHHRIVISRAKDEQPFDPTDHIKSMFMLIDYRFYNEVQLGEHWVFDCRNVTLSHVMALMTTMPKAMYIWTNGFATRVKGIHCVYVSSMVEPLINMLKKLLKQKLVSRFHTYSDFEELYKVFPRSLFPSDYGGGGQSCEQISEAWADTLQSPEWRQWFRTQDGVCADETKRLGPSHLNEYSDGFGAEGSFRQLEID